MSKLTREQVEQYLNERLMRTSEFAVKLCGELLDHDAALRAELEQVEQHRDAVLAEWGEIYPRLQAQLATAQAENERLRNDLSDALDVKAGHGPTVLTDLTARCAQMEEALRLVERVGDTLLKRKFDHCGAMNSTQLDDRDTILNMLLKVSHALTPAAEEEEG